MDSVQSDSKVRSAVRQHYADAAVKSSGCCGGTSSCGCGDSSNSSNAKALYEASELSGFPEDVTNISLGCGNPVAIAALKPGQTVLDLGSGGGIDCFLAAQKVGEMGMVIGVDMTPEMIDRARANKEKMGVKNVEFRLGEIEHLPVADASVDVVISNCVVNLSTDKPQVLHEIMRVLKPGGKMAISDIVTSGEIPESVKKDLNAWAGCIAGAMEIEEMRALLKQTGFVDISLEPVYFSNEVIEDVKSQFNVPSDMNVSTLAKSIFNANISATKSK